MGKLSAQLLLRGMIKESDILIRVAKREDTLEIANLLKRLGLVLPHEPEDLLKHWNRLWDDNPYYTYFTDAVHYGWVMEHNKVIVGFFGSIPRVYQFNQELIPVAIGSHWGVEKEYRAFTKLLSERFFNDNPVSLKLTSTAIKPTGRIYEAYGGHKVPLPELAKVYMIPISLFKLVGLKFKASALKKFIRGLQFLIPWKWLFAWRSYDPSLIELNLADAPEDFAALLDRDIKKTDGLVAYRNLDLLHWFYTNTQGGLDKKLYVYRVNNVSVGFVSLVYEPIKEDNSIIRAKIIDLVADSSHYKKIILKALLRPLYEAKVDVIEIHCPGTIKREDIPSVVFERQHAQFPFYYHTDDPKLTVALQSPQNWNPSPFDGDTAL